MADSARRKLQHASWFAVVRAYQECSRRYARLLQAFDLTVTQFEVLLAIHQLGDQAVPKAIAARLLVTRGNITGVLQRLQARRLLRTHGHARDGRSFVCELTPAGEVLLAQARSAAGRFIEEQMSPFDDAELRESERQMNRMRTHLRKVDPDAIARRALRRR